MRYVKKEPFVPFGKLFKGRIENPRIFKEIPLFVYDIKKIGDSIYKISE